MGQIDIRNLLGEGKARSLGRSDQVVQLMLEAPQRVGELFNCLFSNDEIVRMRSSDALEKLCVQRPELLAPFTKQLLRDVSKIRQPSVQWHLAQILSRLPLRGDDRRQAIAVLRRNLYRYDDWIVTNLTLEALATFVRQSRRLRRSFCRMLRGYLESPHKSVAKRAGRLLAEFSSCGHSSVRIKEP